MKHATDMFLERYLELVVEVQTSSTLWAKKRKKGHHSLTAAANNYHILLAKTSCKNHSKCKKMKNKKITEQ